MSQEPSPYQPPKSSLADKSREPQEIVPVGKWYRFGNLLIDYVVFMLLGIFLGITIFFLFGEEGLRVLESTPDLVIGIPIVLVYYTVMESLTGRTIGKILTGTKVVNAEGNRITFGQVLGRSFSRLIPFEAFSFLFGSGRGLHDSLPNTYVIRSR